MQRARGFTLLEVLVALAVFALAMAALWNGLGQGQALGQGLPDRIMARWVAQNRIVLGQATQAWPDPKIYNGTEEMGGRTWYFEEQVLTTADENLRRLSVSVGSAPGEVLLTLEGFLYRPRGPQLNGGAG